MGDLRQEPSHAKSVVAYFPVCPAVGANPDFRTSSYRCGGSAGISPASRFTPRPSSNGAGHRKGYDVGHCRRVDCTLKQRNRTIPICLVPCNQWNGIGVGLFSIGSINVINDGIRRIAVPLPFFCEKILNGIRGIHAFR